MVNFHGPKVDRNQPLDAAGIAAEESRTFSRVPRARWAPRCENHGGNTLHGLCLFRLVGEFICILIYIYVIIYIYIYIAFLYTYICVCVCMIHLIHPNTSGTSQVP